MTSAHFMTILKPQPEQPEQPEPEPQPETLYNTH